MEVFMWGLSYSANRDQVIVAIAQILHRDDYLGLWGPTPVNLEVLLHKNKRSGIGHSGSGRLTVAVQSVAFQFLQEYGGEHPHNPLHFSGKQVFFKASNNSPRDDIVQKLLRTPYVDPYAQAEKQKRIAEAEANQIPISGIEFGW